MRCLSQQFKYRYSPHFFIRISLLLAVLFCLKPLGALDRLDIFVRYNQFGITTSLSFSPDSRFLLASGGFDLILWDISSGLPLQTFRGHNHEVTSATISPDGRKVAAGNHDGTARIWDIETGRELVVYTGHSSSVYGVTFSPDGQRVLSGSYDRTARLWNAATGETLKVFRGHGGCINTVAISRDGKYAMTGSQDKTLKLWNTSSGQVLKTFSDYSESVAYTAFSADGSKILSRSGNVVKLRDASTGKLVRTLNTPSPQVYAVVFSPDSKYILTGHNDHTLRLWDTASGTILKTITDPHFSGSPIAFSYNNRFIAYGSGQDVKVLDFSDMKVFKTFESSQKTLGNPALSPDGKKVLFAAYQEMFLWDLENISLRQVAKGFFQEVDSLAFFPDGRRILSGNCNYRNLTIWELATGKKLSTFGKHDNSIQSISISPDGTSALSGSFKEFRHWDLHSGREIRKYTPHTWWTCFVTFSPDGRQALSGSYTIKLWDLSTGRLIRTFNAPREVYRCGIFSPDGKTALTGDDGGSLRLWDVSTGKQIRWFKGHTYWVFSATFSPDGRHILSGAGDNTARLWETAAGTELKKFSDYNAWIGYAAFFPDGKRLLIKSRNEISIRDAVKGTEIARLSIFKNDQWLVLTPQGYYDCSPDAHKYLNVRTGPLQVQSIDNYRRDFHRPELVKGRLRGESLETLLAKTKSISNQPLKISGDQPQKSLPQKGSGIPSFYIVIIGFLVVAVITLLVILLSRGKKRQHLDGPDKAVLTPVTKEKVASLEITPQKVVPSCKSATLTVPEDHISTLKKWGAEFSTTLNGKILHLQDRLLFKGFLVAVSGLEPEGPVKITNDTNVSIRSSEEPVILQCVHCGEIQQKIQKNCSACGRELRVTVF